MGRHKAILFKVSRAYGVTQADREDLLQEMALQVWRSVDAFRGDAAIATWIYRVASGAMFYLVLRTADTVSSQETQR